ncbi:spore germination protein [Melghirimyces profundicolus]|uniref:Spore germination protein n=1 Tax=Melghirimyces profundicolus TaxID=1242148 RepID=A0A2T6C8S6_9BACL|nr:GerAB/ArcD/ProY family transporter [Melghirimyces profundicolus]PTX64703.1 spore germination protein [Melghirimyces profundicolus]
MSTGTLFNHEQPLQPWFWAVLVNRLQIGYFLLILPKILVYPYMLWVILMVGLVSSLNLHLIGKCLAIHDGFMKGVWLRVWMVPAIGILLLKMTLIVRGYAGVVHQFLFPSIGISAFIVLMLVAALYLAKHGMTTVLHFCVIAFLASVWATILYGFLAMPPEAHYSYLYPLIPFQWPSNGFESLLSVWSAFAGPEYLIVLGPWSGGKRLTKYLLAGHVFSILEYTYLFFVSLVFLGSPYLKTVEFPVFNLLRYVQLPFFERLEMIVIPAYMTPLILIISLLLLYLYGALRILLNRNRKPAHTRGLFMVSLAVAGYLLMVDRWLWTTEIHRRMWEQAQMYVVGATFALAPALFLGYYAMQSRRRRNEKTG